MRVPGGGIQPQVVVDPQGLVRLIYFSGDPRHGDVYYVRSADSGRTFSVPMRVNSHEGSVTAMGTIRGAQLAVGRAGRVHVAWNGSGAGPKGPLNPESLKNGMPMLYARLNDTGTAFEPERNLMQRTFGLDGGGAVAADPSGNVYVGWHGKAAGAAKGEAGREFWIARSHDDGRTFSPESRAWDERTGACACCGIGLFADQRGTLYGLYRSATNGIHRDIYLLTSRDQGMSFNGALLHKWEINACPMSSMGLAEGRSGVLAAWETGGQVYYAPVRGAGSSSFAPVAATLEANRRKHPRLAVSSKGRTILVWTEGTGWQRGGAIAWQVYDETGKPTAERGTLPGLPAWSFGAVMARADGGFTIVY
ncbi:MAG: exo-alpha-sialidase [Acidobacteria bacterium]|nr:exo-alpha-sialidase [Acidobacteriota bacterium]